MKDLVHVLKYFASVPSFSSWEEVIHPVIKEHLKSVKGLQWHHVPDNNLIATVPGAPGMRPVALSAHLDKINHFGAYPPGSLPVELASDKIIGQMDNAVGLAICSALAQQANNRTYPPLYLLFSEMEESFGLKHHPNLLKNNGMGYEHGLGARRISRYLKENHMIPEAVVTVDTTPLFQGQPGVALYQAHWEFTKVATSEQEKEQTQKLCDELIAIDPNILMANNTNDYLEYGVELNKETESPIPSIAIEPAIYPYHQKKESVFIEDIERVFSILDQWLIEKAKKK